MLLQHLNDFANNRKLLNDMAFEPKAVRWIIPIDSNGNVVGKGQSKPLERKKTEETSIRAPKQLEIKTQVESEIFWQMALPRCLG